MVWTAPPTAVANTFITVALWNTMRDNMLETAPAKAAAAGDTFYATAANAIARLAASASNGGLMQQAAGIPSWLQPVAYRMPRANAAGNLLEYVAGLNLAQAPVFARAAAIGMVNQPSWADIVTQSFVSVGGLVCILFGLQTLETKTGSAQAIHRGRITRPAGTIIGDALVYSDQNGLSQVEATLFGVQAHTPGAGTANYVLQANYTASSTTGTPAATGQMLILEFAP